MLEPLTQGPARTMSEESHSHLTNTDLKSESTRDAPDKQGFEVQTITITITITIALIIT